LNKIVLDNYEEVCKAAADVFAQQLKEKPDSVLGFAVGSTNIGLYKELVRRYDAGEIDFSKARSFNIDEYYPMKKNHPKSHNSIMHSHLFEKTNLAQFSLLSGETDDPPTECARYDWEIKAVGGIDIMFLGIGLNGQIGFNEPADSYPMCSYLVNLSESSIEAGKRYFADDVQPTKALTMGIGGIMRSKKIVLMISGEDKAQIARMLFQDIVHTDVPGSFLNLHPDVTVIMDMPADGIVLRSAMSAPNTSDWGIWR